MDKAIDCLFIGHNEMNFQEYEQIILRMGKKSGSYRDLNLNFIRFNNKPYSALEVYNMFSYDGKYSKAGNSPITPGDTFSAAITYLGSWLHRRGCRFDYINSFQSQKDELKKKLEQENILLIAVITTLYVSVFPILEIMKFVRTHNRTAKVVVGGPFISTQVRVQPPDALEYLFKDSIGADFYVNSSQGEATLVKIIKALKNQIPIDRLNNLYYKKDNNKGYVSTPVLKEENNLSKNMVDWLLFADRIEEHVAVRTSISCPFSCAFCGFPQHAGKYQAAELEAVIGELKLLDKIERVKYIHFIDDTFNIPIKRFKEILQEMIKNNFNFRWHSYFRCQYIDSEMAQLMKESGCEGVFLGIESGSEKILENMNKAAKIEDYLKGITLLKEYNISTFGNFIIGFPGETDETVQDTIKFIKYSGLDFYRAQLWYCEPITPIWEQREKYNLIGEGFEWRHGTMDSKKACDLIDGIFLSIEDPIWIPLYNCDFDGIWHLVHRGMGLLQVKEFLKSFNNGVKEKLNQPYQKEISYKVIKQLKNSCTGFNQDDLLAPKDGVVLDTGAEFDF